MNAPSVAAHGDGEARTFRVTHPFHPLHGCEFPLAIYKCTWGEDRAYYDDGKGRMAAIPACWTDLVAPDPFVAAADGRSPLHWGSLVDLAGIVASLESEGPA